MPLSWNEIKDRALRFAREWADAASEDAEAKSFWDGFFDVFGVSRRRVAHFERRVKKLDGKDGYIKDMPRVMAYLRRTCERYSELNPLVQLLDQLESRPVETGLTF